MMAPSYKAVRVGCLVLIIVVKLVYSPLAIIGLIVSKIGCIHGLTRLHETAGSKKELERRARNL